MPVVILIIIAFWNLPLPLALKILMTVFGSLHCIYRLLVNINEAREGK